MQPLKNFHRPRMMFLLALLACSTRALAQSTQTGKCAACTPVDSSGTCSGMLPVCVDKSSGDSSNLPCAELIAGSEAAYSQNMAAQMQQSMAASMPTWMQSNQPVMQQVPVPSAAELAAAECPRDKPSKMCCSARAFGQSSEATGQQTGSSSTGPTQSQAFASSTGVNDATSVDGATGVNRTSGTSQQLATQQGTPVPAQGSALQTAGGQKGSAGAVQSSASVVAAASCGAALLLQLL